MAYQEWGDPDNPNVVVCVHGLTRIGSDFEDLARALQNNYRVVSPDVVGRGGSSWLKNPMHYGVPQYASDMVTLIARLGVSRVKWVGTSMGGLIGMTLASLADSPIERLVVNDVGAELSGQALARIAAYVGTVTEFPNLAAARVALRKLFSGFGPHSEEQWNRITDSVVVPGDGQTVRVHYDPAIAEPFRVAYGAAGTGNGAPIPNLDLWAVYDAIQCPTLVIRGAQSDLLTAPVLEQMTQRGPRAQSVTFPDVGHAPTLMHDQQIEVVTAFLNARTNP